MTTKSRIVRTRFCKQLRKNLARVLREQLGLVDAATDPEHPDCIRVEARWDNLQVAIPEAHARLLPRVEDILRNTPGIWAINRVLEYPLGDFEEILVRARESYAERLAGKTFVVRCRRVGRHGFNSMEVEKFVGGGLLHSTQATGVSLKEPEVVVALEIRDQTLYIIDARLEGIGGFPIGTQETVISLISGGFDSAVSTFMAMKRGLRCHLLFFNLGGHEHELAVKELSFYLWNRFGSSHKVQFISVPFEEVVREILEKVENSQMGVVLKRMMLRAASRLAEEQQLEALVTGESVAQVSSQTLVNLAIIDEASSKLVLRPLIMSDKQDIVDMARQIGTEQFSAMIPEYCGVISVRPTTRARRHRIEKEESRFDMAVLERALANTRSLDIAGLAEAAETEEAEIVCLERPPAGAVIIDIRHPDEEERAPLRADGYEMLQIPFYRLGTEIPGLNRDASYYLYCGKGVMSRLHAAHLARQGWTNVGVYLPKFRV